MRCTFAPSGSPGTGHRLHHATGLHNVHTTKVFDPLQTHRKVSKGASMRRKGGLNSAPGSMLGISTRMLRMGFLPKRGPQRKMHTSQSQKHVPTMAPHCKGGRLKGETFPSCAAAYSCRPPDLRRVDLNNIQPEAVVPTVGG